jgi:tRNA(fMet)-specific endonuclease VapC
MEFDQLTISSITVTEFVTGLQAHGNWQKLQNFLSELENFEIIHPSLDNFILAGKIDGDLLKKGNSIGIADSLVASVAISNDIDLATGNYDDFIRIVNEGYPLHLINWRK